MSEGGSGGRRYAKLEKDEAREAEGDGEWGRTKDGKRILEKETTVHPPGSNLPPPPSHSPHLHPLLSAAPL